MTAQVEQTACQIQAIENKSEKTNPFGQAATTRGGFQPDARFEKTNPFTAGLCTRDTQFETRKSLNCNA
jgi:hypothetical protein